MPELRPLLVASLMSFASLASANEKKEAALVPYVDAKISDSGKRIDIGFERYPFEKNGGDGIRRYGALGVRGVLSTKKSDPDNSFVDPSSEALDLSAKVALLYEGGSTDRISTKYDGANDTPPPSRWGGSLTGSSGLSSFSYRRLVDERKQTDFKHTWAVEARVWWLELGKPSEIPEDVSAEVNGTGAAGAGLRDKHFGARIWQPQLHLKYERTWKASDAAVVVSDVDARPLLGEVRVIEGPDRFSQLSFLAALPVEPRRGRFAFGPALRYTMKSKANRSSVTDGVSRLRGEFWVYFFAFASGHLATRVGLAPYVDVRVSGDDKRDEVTGGAVLDLRSSTSRLEY